MGGQASKIEHQNEGCHPKVPPILSRKLEAIERRKSSSSLSKQSLLKYGSEDGSSNDRNPSTVSSREPDDDSFKYAKIAPESIEPFVSDKDDNKGNSGSNDNKKKKIVEKKGRVKKDRPNLMCPGSPSFRCYLTENEQEDHCSSKDGSMMKGSFSDTDVDVVKEIDESPTSSEELESKIKKRGRRGMRFRNFLNVRSCYYPTCGGHEINQPLITQTPAAL